MTAPALLIVDVQKGLDEPSLGPRNNPDAEANMARRCASPSKPGAIRGW